MKQIDESPTLIQAIANLASWLARQRGLPIVIGIIFVIGGGTLEFFNIFFDNMYVEIVHVIFHHFGLVTALIGIALLEPLGT